MLLSTHASLLHPTPAHNLVVGRDEVLTLQGTIVVNKITSVWTKLRRGFRHKPHPREVGCHFAPSTTKLLFSKDGGIRAPVGLANTVQLRKSRMSVSSLGPCVVDFVPDQARLRIHSPFLD